MEPIVAQSTVPAATHGKDGHDIIKVKEIAAACQSAAELSETCQSTADLSETCQPTANLSENCQSTADLSETCQSTADLSETCQSSADLSETCQSRADLSETFQSSAEIPEARMTPGNCVVLPKEQNDCEYKILSQEVLHEEEKIRIENEEKEEKLRQEQDKIWKHLDEETREQRYQRLQFLLSKSNMYTQYLVERMERQKVEQRKQREQQEKKEAKKPQGQDVPLQDVKSTALKRTRAMCASSKEKENLSTGSLQDDAGPAASSPQGSVSKRGRKRKAASSPSISKFLKVSDSRDRGKIEVDGTARVSLQSATSSQEDTSKISPQSGAISQEDTSGASLLFQVQKEEEAAAAMGKPLLFTGGELRQYQIEGFQWLKVLYENGVNGILADEMGLGKTVQCIALLADLCAMGVSGPFLVCAPLSTLPNWKAEFARFTPKVPVLFYHGTKEDRCSLRSKMRKEYDVCPGIKVQPVVITSYEMAMVDRKYICGHDWKYLIVDEGHRIKNTHCRLIRELRMYRNTHRLLLTGTPLQNNMAELWSLLNFLLPEIFDDLGSFEAWFDVEHISTAEADEAIVAEEQKKQVLSMLHQILTPFMLRRVKTDVDLMIPPKKEVLVYAPLSKLQQDFYTSTVDKTIMQKVQEEAVDNISVATELTEKGRPRRKSVKAVKYDLFIESSRDSRKNKQKEEEELESWIEAVIDNQTKATATVEKQEKVMKKSEVTIRLQNVMMQLRKCCNHPYLLQYPLNPQTGDYKIDEELITNCGKMKILDLMLKELQKNGHKVLLFSQMTKMLDILEDFCYLRKYKFCRLDGSCNVQDRQDSMEAFNTDAEIFLFLLSTRSGGLGINLTAADTVIIYDSDWNPQSDLQAQDRCHRIGQTKPVVVYRFVTANTIDQRIVERAAAKRKLEKIIIHKGKFKTGIAKGFQTKLKPLCGEELMELLKSRDHSGVVQGHLNDDIISAEQLYALLDRSDLHCKMTDMEKKGRSKKSQLTKEGESSAEVAALFKVVDIENSGSMMD